MKIFWDTNLYIYLWENSEHTDKVLRLAEAHSKNEVEIVTSSLSLGEILVKPFSEGKTEEVEKYVRWFQEIEIVSFGLREAIIFARLRSQYSGIKPPDAIQLSCAISNGASQFVTNDDRLSRLNLEEVAVFSLEEALRQ